MIIDGEEVNLPKCIDCGKEIVFTQMVIIRDWQSHRCRDCHTIFKHKQYLAAKAGDPDFKDKDRNRSFRKKYGITILEYKQLLSKQKGVCAICGNPDMTGKSLGVDHDHKTGKIRELLCNKCNILIGHCNEDPNILRKCIAYLEKHSELDDSPIYHDGFVHSFI